MRKTNKNETEITIIKLRLLIIKTCTKSHKTHLWFNVVLLMKYNKEIRLRY